MNPRPIHPVAERLIQLAEAPLNPGSAAQNDRLNFPLDSLPSDLRAFTREAASAIGAPIDFIAIPVLVATAAAIGAHRMIRLKDEWVEPSTLYAAIVAAPGTLKTPALKIALSPVQEIQIRWADEFQVVKEQYEKELAECLRSKKAQPRLQVPIQRRTWTADITVERLAGLLAENTHGLVIWRDELTGWVRSMNQYKGGKGSDRQFYLSCWSAAPVTVDRQGKPPILVHHPIVSVVGCVPPDALYEFDNEAYLDDGFLHRLLWTFPDPMPTRWTESKISEATAGAYRALIQNLYLLPPGADGKTTVYLGLDEQARALFKNWHDDHCAEAEDLMLNDRLRGFMAKLKGYCARFALIHAVSSQPNATIIGRDSIEAAIELVRYFKAQAQKVIPFCSRRPLSPKQRAEREILKNLSRLQPCTKRDLQRAGHTDGQTFNQALEALIKLKRIIVIEKGGLLRLAENEDDLMRS